MYKAIHAKFTQHKDNRELLLATGDALLVEHTPDDKFWGDGGDGGDETLGQNKLGKIITRVREDIKKNMG